MQFVEPHQKSLPEKKNQLHNTDHKVAEGIYVAGTLAGWRSQLAIAAGSVRCSSHRYSHFGITVFRHMFTIVLDKP
jgi:uncharacterized protein (DUF927 family)